MDGQARTATQKRRASRRRAHQRAVCERKVRYLNEAEASAAALHVFRTMGWLQDPYACQMCPGYHLRTRR